MLPLLLAFGAGAALSYYLRPSAKTSVSTGLDEFGDYRPRYAESYPVATPYRAQAAQFYGGRTELTGFPRGPVPANNTRTFVASPFRRQAAYAFPYRAFQPYPAFSPLVRAPGNSSVTGYVTHISNLQGTHYNPMVQPTRSFTIPRSAIDVGQVAVGNGVRVVVSRLPASMQNLFGGAKFLFFMITQVNDVRAWYGQG